MSSRRRQQSVSHAAQIAIGLFGLICLGSLYWAFADPGLAKWLAAQPGLDGAKILLAKFAIWLAIIAISGGLMLALVRRLRRRPVQSFEFETQPARTHTPTEFEYEVAALIHMLSGYRTEVCGKTGDGGIDVKVFDENSHMVGIVQCKQYAPDRVVPPAHIRALNAVRHYHHANIAYLVTTGKFSKASYRLAKDFNIRLIDGAQLEKLRRQATKSRKPTAAKGG